MRWLLFDIWSKKARALIIALLALTMNLVAPVPGGAQTVNPQASSQSQNINKVTPSKPSSKQPAQHTNLPNSGPGDIVALFFASSLLAGIVYRRILLYRHTP